MLEISVQTGGLPYSDTNPDRAFSLMHECGFEAVDFNIDTKLPGSAIVKGPLTTFFDQSIEELIEYYRPIKESAERNGISFGQMHAPFPLWVKDKEDVNQYIIMVVEKICAICQFVGCPALVVHPITRSTKEKELDCNLTLYRNMMPAAKKYGVKLCLENLFSTYFGRVLEGPCSEVDEACAYIDQLNAEAGEEVFGFCLDVGHANLLGRKLREYIKKLGHRLTILHIHDNDGCGDLHMAPYTFTKNWGKDLVCDWEGLIEGLKEINYRGTLNFETFRAALAVPPEVLPDMLKYISAVGRYFRGRILGEIPPRS